MFFHCLQTLISVSFRFKLWQKVQQPFSKQRSSRSPVMAIPSSVLVLASLLFTAHAFNGLRAKAATSSNQKSASAGVCSTHTKFDGGNEWKGKCLSLQECQDKCTGDCAVFNWWPNKGGCRTNKGSYSSSTTSWISIGGDRACTAPVTLSQPTCEKCSSVASCRPACSTTVAYRGDKLLNNAKCNTLTECQTRCTNFGSCVGFNYWPTQGKCRLFSSKTKEEVLDSTNQHDRCIAGGRATDEKSHCSASDDDSTPPCSYCPSSRLAAGDSDAPTFRQGSITCRA